MRKPTYPNGAKFPPGKWERPLRNSFGRRRIWNSIQIENKRLADLAGTHVKAITTTEKNFDEFSFVINCDAKASHVALRPKWETGRRFDLARLIGDRLFPTGESLCPATRAHSYRQKVQRAFAAHFLSPVQAIEAMLNDDDSEEGKREIANHFQVSDLTIDNLADSNIPAW